MNTRSTVISFVCLCLTAPLFAQGPQNPPSQGILWETVIALEERIDNEGMPLGAIIMWSGTIDGNGNPEIGGTPDTNWQICNGTNGTPDLRDRFVVGSGSSYFTTEVGGANSVTLTKSQMPGHNHSFSDQSSSTGAHSHYLSGSISSTGSHSHLYSGNTSLIGNHQHYYYDRQAVGTEEVQGWGLAHAADDNWASNKKWTSLTGSHNHTFGGGTQSAGSHWHSNTFSIASVADHYHSVSGNTGNTGGNSAHENLPPYYALAFIMKIQ